MGELRIWIVLLAVFVSSSASFAQESEKVGSKTGRGKKQTTKPASFRRKASTTTKRATRSQKIATAPAKVLSIRTVSMKGSRNMFVIVTLTKQVDRLWLYVHSADPSNKEVPYIRHAKRVPIAALRKAGITGLKGDSPRYLCPIPKSDLRNLKGEALFAVTFAGTKQPHSEVSSCWYYHLATNTSTKVVDITAEPKSATSPTKGQAAGVLKGS